MLAFRIGSALVPVKVYEDFSITHKSDGCDKMQFFVDTTLEQYALIKEETQMETDDNIWLIKKVDDDRIDCELNFDFLKRTVHHNYNSGSKLLIEILESVLPDGWVVVGADISSISRTITFDLCTNFDIAYACMATYDVRFRWSIKEKKLYVYKLSEIPVTGEYLSSELNLKDISYKGNTTGFATRLYAYGKDGLGLEGAIVESEEEEGTVTTYGLPYVDDNTYADKVVCDYWSDERYTDPNSLLEAARNRLSQQANPVVSYECKIVDLAKQNPDEYGFLEFVMFRKINLIDLDRKKRVVHHIVEYTEYPDDTYQNVVTLSTVPNTIHTRISKISDDFNDSIDITKTDFDYRIALATGLLLNAFGGHVLVTEAPNAEIFIMDNEDPELAQVVWRFNINGIGKSSTGIDGPYTTALTVDDSFITSTINALIIRGSRIEAGSITADQISLDYTDDVIEASTTITADAIKTQYIDKINEKMTEFTESIAGLLLQFTNMSSGGTNYVKNSSGLNGVSDDWHVDTLDNQSTPVVTTEEDNDTVSGSCFRLSENTVLYQDVGGLLPDKDYCLSMKVRKTSTQQSQVILIYGTDSQGQDIQELLYSQSVVSEGWDRIELLLSRDRGSTVRIKFTTNSDYFYVADVMLSEGNIIKGWEPAPNEIYTQGVKIDEKGIEVYRSDTSEKTVINNREFAGYYEEEKVFSINKDETHIKKTVVDGELIIGQGRIIPYHKNGETGISITINA